VKIKVVLDDLDLRKATLTDDGDSLNLFNVSAERSGWLT
jgi:hypothetical protein